VIVGRIGGYALDYGLGASGAAGVTEVYTSVDEYKTRGAAKAGLAWESRLDRAVSSEIGQSGQGGLAFRFKAEKVAPLGTRRFAFLASYSAANIAPVFGLDEQFTEGRYEADVTVWAGSAAAATTLAPSLAKKLDARIKLALKGKLHAKPVKLPPQQQSGPLPGGPDLTALAFQPSDFGLDAPTTSEGYLVPRFDPTALSAYSVTTCMGEPRYCGTFGDQDIEWCPSPNQASFMADLWAAWSVDHAMPSQVDLSGVGDGARGFFGDGESAVVLSSGRLMEFILVAGVDQASDVQRLAQTAANKINAAGLGD
jgi:hypothetical protein